MKLNEIERFIIDAGSDDLGVFGGDFEGGVHVQQIADELAPCIHEILKSKKKIKSYIEIGVAAGGTTHIINEFFCPEKIVLVDDNKHHKAGHRPVVLEGVDRIELIGRSDDENVIIGAKESAPYDLLLIDGDHTYACVKLDSLTYIPLVSDGGFIVLHDSALENWGVARVVRELKEDSSLEFIGEYVSKTHPAPCGVALFRKANK